jgi:large subunit ribosomal protein L10
MNRQGKELLVESLRRNFTESQGTFLVGVQGLTVSQIQSLRKDLRKEGGSMRVAKNTLLTIASRGVEGAEQLQPYFKQQVAVVFARTDVPSVARVIFDATKSFEKLSIVVGSFEGVVIDENRVKFLALLPSREQLLAQVCWSIAAPLSALVGVLDQVVKQLAGPVQQVAEQEK